MISQLLISILEGLGHRFSPPLLHKRIRDDVIWDTGSENPWRRTPYWLVLRVGIARHLNTKFGPESGRARYKILLCVVLAQLLRSSVRSVGMDILHNLRAKLARRLAKLHADRTTCAPSVANIYNEMLPHLEPLFYSTLQSATRYIDETWDGAKRALLRPIPHLPLRASRDSLRLTLPRSGAILDSILAKPSLSDKARKTRDAHSLCCGTQAVRETISCYSRLTSIEQEVDDGIFAAKLDGTDDRNACLMVSNAIEAYLNHAGSAYDGLPELQSSRLLTVVEMWMLLDRRATAAIPLLRDYTPAIPAAALDVLQLPTGHDMRRLQGIQDYIQSREKRAESSANTIFATPSAHCFAVRYYNECDRTNSMSKLFQKIKKEEEIARDKTIQEWKKLSKRYESLTLRITEAPCMCGGPIQRKRGQLPKCTKCKMKQERKKLKMHIHEDFLPKDEAQSKAVVFELRCPPIFATYRAAVWSILIRLGYPSLEPPSEPTWDLCDYGSLARFRTGRTDKITLASAIKSHLKSHYKRRRLPMKLDEALRPHGMFYRYQDATTRSWCAQKTKPGFSVGGEGPSSNEVLAGQTQCPSGLSVHEFTAIRSLFTGKWCRWPSMLIELGSSNINFSNEAVVLIVTQLAVHAGTFQPDNPLRTVHSIFRDQEFCARLLDQIARRLDVIAFNWREANPAALSTSLRLALLRDIRSRSRMSKLVRSSIERNLGILTTAIDNVWPSAAGDEERQYSHLEFIDSPSRQLIRLKVGRHGIARQQVLHYDPLDGGLFIDGKPLSQLPAEYRDNWILNELFGKQNIFTYPSYLPGMDYTMNFAPEGHQIHFGILGKSLVIRARYRGHTLQLIPRDVFGSFEQLDLPASLVENCIHWLDLTTGVVEVRQKPDIWIQRDSNWSVDLRCRLARRRRVFLVNPGSALFNHVANIFQGFEHRARLTVFQPEAKKGSLSVELCRLDLNFSVNGNGQLYCRELQAEVDPDQDAGTWYGLESKIVLRDSLNRSRRKILVALGPLSWTRQGIHVAIHTENCGNYGIFTINNVLGRLECPAEARLLLFKALLHAYTASIVPDPLTRRSGTEEALHCLRSGQIQPWMPLNPMMAQNLSLLARLTPKRIYYPPGRKAMQQVFWDDQLPTAMQHEAFHSAVAAIYNKSTQLSAFCSAEPMTLSLEDMGSPHLRKRSSARRSNFGRIDLNSVELSESWDVLYRSRACQTHSGRRASVLESTTLINTWKAEFPTKPNLTGLLQGWSVFQMRGESAKGFLLLTSLLGAEAATEWGSWLSFCRKASVADKYVLCFGLGALAFQQAGNMDVVRVLISFAILDDLKKQKLPPWSSYIGFIPHEAPSAARLLQLISPFLMPDDNWYAAAVGARQQHVAAHCQDLSSFLASHFPHQLPSLGEAMGEMVSIEDIPAAMDIVKEEWTRLQRNAKLSTWVSCVQGILNRLFLGKHTHLADFVTTDDDSGLQSRRERDVPCLDDLLRKSHVRKPGRSTLENSLSELASLAHDTDDRHASTPEIQQLRSIIAEMASSGSVVRELYGKDLNRSLEALEAVRRPSTAQKTAKIPQFHEDESVESAETSVLENLELISRALDSSDSRVAWLKEGGVWPCISPVTLLERLRTTAKVAFGAGMKDALVKYGRSITDLQQQLRIDDARMRGNDKAAAEEAGNPGHDVWSPSQYPDWLLIEIDGNFLIRPHQIDVAISTMSPPSGGNSVLQMNMGQGKTSCILPMIASVLADTQRLVRIIVPRALLVQTAQVLQARVGNLLGREVRSVPFSRRTPTTLEYVNTFTNIHQDIMSSYGIMITLPETILSFKLSTTQRLLDKNTKEARHMMAAQVWMKKVGRDILDECDFTLAPKTQLIYPSGPQQSLDGHPSRWQTAQTLLELVRSHLHGLKVDFPCSLEIVQRGNGGFPWVFFLRSDAENALVTWIVDHIARGKTRLISLASYSQEDCNVVRRFIGDTQPEQDDERRIQSMFAAESSSRKTLYLLRGLLAHGILILALKKRWNVQYGLHPLRDPVSVPYHSKGVPSDQAEWGHPDVSILLTCLSFYFAGLTTAQLQKCIIHILQADDPAGEYGHWAGSSETPPCHLQEWSTLNVDDELQMHELWTHLRYNISVIECFLNHFVFPVHARHFQTQILASGWDIPLYGHHALDTTQASRSKHFPLTTGFSGTNDNRYLLPLTIEQHDLSGLVHTNADVLTYLLQARNRGYVLASRGGKRLSEEALLRKIQELEIRVFVDAGAQILEMDNLTLVKTWMRIDHSAKAALYFNSENKLFILYRSGMQVPLLASSMVSDLSECLVYLDEAHTRGTDLKLPPNAKGALTIGMGQTKDHTVQEVNQSILDHRGGERERHPDSRDVVRWLLEQTCRGIEQLQPLYHSQGIDFCHRFQVSLGLSDRLTNKKHRKAFVKEIRHVENHTLQDMYQPRRCGKAVPTVLAQPSQAIAAQLTRLKDLGFGFGNQAVDYVSSTALQEVEQEREVAHEVEAVRKVQKPTNYRALPYDGLHQDIVHFEKTGELRHDQNGYESLADAFRRALFCQQIFVSKEFSRTVELKEPDDTFMRPVNWLLWSTQTQIALVVTPEEAEDLIPRKRGFRTPMTHLLMYAAPITRRMLHFSKFNFCAIPSMPAAYQPPQWLATQLGLFAGRLYFHFDEYIDLTKLLGIGTGFQHGGPGYRGVPEEGALRQQTTVLSSGNSELLAFLHEWLVARRKGQEFTQTPMGYICEGKPLSARHPFFSSGTPTGSRILPSVSHGPEMAGSDAGSSDEDTICNCASGEESE
ncbi:hypothetical protein SLS56_012136 [Neofusicoccum ribis]|uniref:ubiquitinyl hydrolase 1 n=1 Tax=Neofusicoccum ribis TaxID=45134 RepID=A0ABR3S9P4_9PEZI